jgi:hypothetical protein
VTSFDQLNQDFNIAVFEGNINSALVTVGLKLMSKKVECVKIRILG